MSQQTPLMLQYNKIKSEYPSEVLFFRLGDFYEMFNQDAIEVSRLLNLTLTHRGESPMCGIPYHAAKIYIARLLRCGKKIAICEQISLPIGGKGLAERKVIEVITPGTAVEEEYLEQGANNYLAALCAVKEDKGKIKLSFSYIDVSTGDFFATSWDMENLEEKLLNELGRSNPRELVVAKSLYQNQLVRKALESYPSLSVTFEEDWHFSQETGYKRLLAQFGTTNLRSFSLLETSPEVSSAGYLIEYVLRTTAFSSEEHRLPHVTNLQVYTDDNYVIIDDASRRNLEITSNLRDGTSQFSLLETVQYNQTAMGNRLLRSFFYRPLCTINHIQTRQQHVQVFVDNPQILQKVREELSHILDIERLSSRIAMEKAHGKDIQALKNSLKQWLKVRSFLEKLDSSAYGSLTGNLEIQTGETIIALIEQSILEDPSTSLTEGRLIKDGWSQDLDHYRQIQTHFTEFLDTYLEQEKAATGIQNLKIRYNRNIGYYLEVSKGKLDAVPDHFILRRALVNGDRYTSIKLQELEQELVTAGEKIIELEKKLFLEIRDKIGEHISYLLQVASEIAYVDTICSLAYAAQIQKWVCPEIDNSSNLEISEGRHPVVEYHLPSGEFVPNSASFQDKKFSLITGPNMAGKSTYLRQNALIVLLAQIGSFVPASSAKIGIVDRIFCRVGASDNLARGESTFLVEMTETALILRSATKKSLVIMDEVGRGTSTEDGLSIAWAVSEYLLNNIGCRTFFATHYHELTRMVHPSLQLLCLQVLEENNQIVFLKKIAYGATQNSYGIHVARLAGIPSPILERAEHILESLQNKATNTELPDNTTATTFLISNKPDTKKSGIPGLFSDEELVLDEILSSSVDMITPLEALQKLARWKKILMAE